MTDGDRQHLQGTGGHRREADVIDISTPAEGIQSIEVCLGGRALVLFGVMRLDGAEEDIEPDVVAEVLPDRRGAEEPPVDGYRATPFLGLFLEQVVPLGVVVRDRSGNASRRSSTRSAAAMSRTNAACADTGRRSRTNGWRQQPSWARA